MFGVVNGYAFRTQREQAMSTKAEVGDGLVRVIGAKKRRYNFLHLNIQLVQVIWLMKSINKSGSKSSFYSNLQRSNRSKPGHGFLKDKEKKNISNSRYKSEDTRRPTSPKIINIPLRTNKQTKRDKSKRLQSQNKRISPRTNLNPSRVKKQRRKNNPILIKKLCGSLHLYFLKKLQYVFKKIQNHRYNKVKYFSNQKIVKMLLAGNIQSAIQDIKDLIIQASQQKKKRQIEQIIKKHQNHTNQLLKRIQNSKSSIKNLQKFTKNDDFYLPEVVDSYSFIKQKIKSLRAAKKMQERIQQLNSQTTAKNFSLLYCNSFIINLGKFILNKYNEPLIQIMNSLFGLTQAQKLANIHKTIISTNNEEDRVLGNSIFQQFIKKLGYNQIQQTFNKAIFDCFNNQLNSFRPYYEIGGEPLPWTINQKIMNYYLINQQNIEQVFDKARIKVLSNLSMLAGILIQDEKQKVQYQGFLMQGFYQIQVQE